MVYCLIHVLPWGIEMASNKRMVRTFVMGTICYFALYLLLHTKLLEYNAMMSMAVTMISKWLWLICAMDLSLLGILNKGFIGSHMMTNFFGPKLLTQEVVPQIQGSDVIGASKIADTNDVKTNPETTPVVKETTPVVKETTSVVKETTHEVKETTPKRDVKYEVTADDLNIDLLTDDEGVDDNDVELDEGKTNAFVEKSDTHVDEKKTNTCVEKSDTHVDETDTHVVENDLISSHPKLTQDNIEKYVTMKKKICVDPSVKSEDLIL